MGGKYAEEEQRATANKTSEDNKIQQEHGCQRVVRGAGTAANPDSLLLLRFIFWQMARGARRKKYNDSGIIYHQRPFPHSLFLAENHRLITENDFSWKPSFWQQQPSNPHLQLAGYVHLPPEAHTLFHITLVISGDST